MKKEYEFKIEKVDVTNIMKKNTKKRTEAQFEKAIEKINKSTSNGLGLLCIKNKIDELKESFLKEVESQKDSILKASHDRSQIEIELNKYLLGISKKLEKIINDKKGFKVTYRSIYNDYISTRTLYSNDKGIIIDLKNRNEVFATLKVEVKNVKDINNFELIIKNAKINGTTNLIEKNKEIFFNLISNIDLLEICKTHLVILNFYKNNVSRKNFKTNYEVTMFLEENFPMKKEFKNSEDLINEFILLKDLVELQKDIKINILSKKGLQEIIK